jgi:hypothetical protein
MGSRRLYMKDEAIGKRTVVEKFIARGPPSGLVCNYDETRPCWEICMGIKLCMVPLVATRRMSGRVVELQHGRARTFTRSIRSDNCGVSPKVQS